MKKIIAILCAGLMLMACTTNKQTFSTQNLQGKYEIDFSSLLSELNTDNEEDAMAAALAAMLLAQMEMTMQFDGDQLIIDASPAVRNLVSVFGNKDAQMPFTVAYEIREDSVLYTKTEGEEFSNSGVLRKTGDTFDTLQWVLEDEDGIEEAAVLTLRKQVK